MTAEEEQGQRNGDALVELPVPLHVAPLRIDADIGREVLIVRRGLESGEANTVTVTVLR